ncbi:VRR-NUC domain-containing protein, partial [Pseudomonas aeruginosa]
AGQNWIRSGRPAQRRYRMVEVKGPGDRLQDNQLRWLQFCCEREMPVAVCYVRWHVDD